MEFTQGFQITEQALLIIGNGFVNLTFIDIFSDLAFASLQSV
jgi:hypothetical protein